VIFHFLNRDKVKMSKVKSANFSKAEKDYLVVLVEEAINIVENKKTDAKSSTDKDAEWRRLAVQFNVKFPADSRTGVQLMNCWRNLKRAAKAEFARSRRSKLVTGGGEAEPGPDSICIKVASLVPGQIHPLPNRFDCDAPLDLTRKSESDSDTEDAMDNEEIDSHDDEPSDSELEVAQISAKDKAYGTAESQNAEFHRVRMRKLRLKMKICD
jgi:hypothetical protein